MRSPGAGAVCRRWGSFSAWSSCGACLRELEPGYPAQHLAQAGSARHHGEPRLLRYRRGQQPDRTRHAVHRRGWGERAARANWCAMRCPACCGRAAQPHRRAESRRPRLRLGLGVPRRHRRAHSRLRRRHRAAHAAARAAAAGDRGLCRAHARRQGRADADRGLSRCSASVAFRCSCCWPAIATRRIRARSRPSSSANSPAFTASTGSAMSPISGRSGRARISPCWPHAARACRRACSRRPLAAAPWWRPTRRAAARSPLPARPRLTVPVDDAAALADAMAKLAGDADDARSGSAANARALVERNSPPRRSAGRPSRSTIGSSRLGAGAVLGAHHARRCRHGSRPRAASRCPSSLEASITKFPEMRSHSASLPNDFISRLTRAERHA